MFLPWYTVPGGSLERRWLLLRGVVIPSAGSAWQSLGLLSILPVALVAAGVLLTVLVVAERPFRFRAVVYTSWFGLLVVALIVDKLFLRRPGGSRIVLGAGGYFGLAASGMIAIGALLVAREHRRVAASPGDRRPREVDDTDEASPRTRPAAEIDLGSVASREPTSAEKARGSVAIKTGPERPLPRPEVGAYPLDWVRAASSGRWVRIGVAMAAIVVVYLGTRLWFVGRFPYFLDEVLYAGFTDQGATSAHKLFVSLTVGQGPLFPWLAIVWVKLGFAPLTAVRLVSVTSGLLTVGVVGLLGRRLAGAAVGWVSAALCLVLPFFVVHDGIGIYEPFVTLIMASALYLQLAHAGRPDLRVAALLGLVLAAGILTKESTLPALALLPVSLLCFDWSPADRRHRITVWLCGVTIVSVLVVAAELVLRSSAYYKQLEAVNRNFLLTPGRSLTSVLDYPFAASGQAWATYRPALIGYVTVPLIATGAVGAILAWRSRPRLTAVLLTWIFVSFMVALLFLATSMPRHVMYAMPPVIVLIAYALVRGAEWVRRHVPRRPAAIVCAVAAALLLAPALVLDLRVLAHPATAPYPGLDYWQYVAGYPSGVPWQGVPDVIRSRARGRPVVIVTPSRYDMLQLLFWHDRRYVFTSPGSPLASHAQFAVVEGASASTLNGIDRQHPAGSMHYVAIRQFARPAGPCSGPRERACGGTVTVFERRQGPAGTIARGS
jgi:4-amino-4-deoxy-L-arabinose transferase-like glycosyltransferase